jgi:class 3 adenylate cyclase
MPRFPIFRLGQTAEEIIPPQLTSYTPALTLQGLQLGVDNLRHDVFLSPKFVEQVRLHVARLIMRSGNVESLVSAELSNVSQENHFLGSNSNAKARTKAGPSELKPLLAEIHLAALNRAKADGNICIDLLARAAIIKFLRAELNSQFVQILERCRMMLKSYEGVRQQKAMEYRERAAEFQVAKKIILRLTGQEIFRTLREIEKETLTRTRRSLFGNQHEAEYQLFMNPLVFTEDGRDPYLCGEQYVMLGTFDRDPDYFTNIRRIGCDFLQSLALGPDARDVAILDGWLSVPENAQELVGAGTPEESTPEGKSQKVRLSAWLQLLEQEKAMDHIIASYEVVPLMAEYCPRIHPQQLKNGLVLREERERVEKLIREHGKLSSSSFVAASGRVTSYRGAERTKVAGRFLRDFILYHRDLRRLEALTGTLDSVNLVAQDKIRQLSALNGTLYEFLLTEEQRPAESKVLRHVILKADVRDSSRLTRSLLERDMNPASYFSLNFYGPVNKLLETYGATKVFLEGDAIILAFLEREGEPALAVAKASVLAREMIDIVKGYNRLIEQSGLPALELGIGISYQDSAPMYLMDGEQRIMISDALNESDRLSSCNKRVRKMMAKMDTPFNVYAFQTVSDADAGESPEDFIMKYNLSGIRISAAAFQSLQNEISLAPLAIKLPALWGSEEFSLFKGLVPVGKDIFRPIVVRATRIPQVDTHDFGLQHWTESPLYEVCSNSSIYEAIEGKAAAGK